MKGYITFKLFPIKYLQMAKLRHLQVFFTLSGVKYIFIYIF